MLSKDSLTAIADHGLELGFIYRDDVLQGVIAHDVNSQQFYYPGYIGQSIDDLLCDAITYYKYLVRNGLRGSPEGLYDQHGIYTRVCTSKSFTVVHNMSYDPSLLADATVNPKTNYRAVNWERMVNVEPYEGLDFIITRYHGIGDVVGVLDLNVKGFSYVTRNRKSTIYEIRHKTNLVDFIDIQDPTMYSEVSELVAMSTEAIEHCLKDSKNPSDYNLTLETRASEQQYVVEFRYFQPDLMLFKSKDDPAPLVAMVTKLESGQDHHAILNTGAPIPDCLWLFEYRSRYQEIPYYLTTPTTKQ